MLETVCLVCGAIVLILGAAALSLVLFVVACERSTAAWLNVQFLWDWARWKSMGSVPWGSDLCINCKRGGPTGNPCPCCDGTGRLHK